MGKNHGKRGKKTEYAKWESIMARLNNQLKKEAADKKKESKGGSKDA